AAFVGTWKGRNVSGSIDMRPDGSYRLSNGGNGRWNAKGDSVTIQSGPLTAWDHGHGHLTDKGALVFAADPGTARGATYYVFGKD
ncbi:MAG: hypothetical protein K2Q10_12905, partial [Rhodospirillales bacterium]|nr:hypothetical protein [Rhodospirillales bacterium]